MSNVIAVITLDGTPKYFTPSIEWYLGYSDDELKGLNILNLIHFNDQQNVKSAIKLAKENRNIPLNLPEFRIKHKHGAWFYVEGNICNKSDDEHIGGYVINITDITQRKLYELDYARLLGAIRISTDSFLICDNDENIIFANDATMRLYGTTDKNDIIGKNVSNLIDKREIHNFFVNNKKEETFTTFEHNLMTNTDETIPVESSIAVMRDIDLNQIGFVYITRDIRERKKVENEIQDYRDHLEDLVDARTKELHESVQKLHKTLEGVVQSMANTVESRDPYTAGHQKRVAEIAGSIARIMGLPEDTIDSIKIAGLVHDVGKIYVPAEILSRHGDLDEVEFLMVKKHPQVGYNILKSIDFPWPIAEIVFQHHEKINGSGYPQGLKSDEILLEAKIICVADVVEAMTIHRPYREGLGLEEALKEIDGNKGIFYDEKVALACLKLFREEGYQLD